MFDAICLRAQNEREKENTKRNFLTIALLAFVHFTIYSDGNDCLLPPISISHFLSLWILHKTKNQHKKVPTNTYTSGIYFTEGKVYVVLYSTVHSSPSHATATKTRINLCFYD